MAKGLENLIAPAQPVFALPELDSGEVTTQVRRRARRDVARRALPGAYPYPVLFVAIVLVSGTARTHPATISVLAVGLAVFTALRVLYCRSVSQTPLDETDRPTGFLRWAVLSQAAVWSFFAGFMVHAFGMEWESMVTLLCTGSILAGGLFGFAPDLTLARAFAVTILVPVTTLSVADGSPAAQVTALFMTLYGGILIQMTSIQHREYWRSAETNELLRRHAVALATARREAEKASRAKGTFLANISHELRTPLHGVLSYARFGMSRVGKVDDTKLVEYFERIETSGNGLLALFDDLLDLSRLEAGRMSCHPEVQRIEPIVTSLADEVRGRCLEGEIELVVDVEEPLAYAAVDTARFKQVVRNLTANAIRFSPTGATLRLEMQTDDDSVRVVVDDEGPGVPEAELESIFEKFVQSSTTSTGAGGTGLGLAISRQLMALHGGKLWAENRRAGGARFVAELPRAARRTPVPSEPQTA